MPLMNRTLSIRNNKPAASNKSQNKIFGRFSGGKNEKPDNARRLNQLVKSQNNLVDAHHKAASERALIANQLSTWGGDTGDDAVVDLSDKIGVLLLEIADHEDAYSDHLESVRGRLKIIRNTEKDIAPSRAERTKIMNDIQKLKMKDPESEQLETLEQALVRSEAQNLVADAQLSNVTRQKLKQAYSAEFSAIIERAEKQLILAKHGRRLLQLLDDSPTVPGATRPAYEYGLQARQILNDAEDDMREWQPDSYEEYEQDDDESFEESSGVGLSSEAAPSGEASAPRSVTTKKNKKANHKVVDLSSTGAATEQVA